MEDLIFTPSLRSPARSLRNWEPGLCRLLGHRPDEAVRSGAVWASCMITLRGSMTISSDPAELSIRRSYWIIFHESVRALARIRVVADFLHEAVDAERSSFL